MITMMTGNDTFRANWSLAPETIQNLFKELRNIKKKPIIIYSHIFFHLHNGTKLLDIRCVELVDGDWSVS